MRISKTAFNIIVVLLLLDNIALSLVFLGSDISINTLGVLTVLNIIQSAIVIIFCANKLKERFTLFSFNVAFFILLQGAYAMNIGNTRFYGTHVFAYVSHISYDNEAKGLMYILIAQSITFMSYFLFETNQEIDEKDTLLSNNNSSLRSWSRVFMLIGAIAAFVKVGLKITFVAVYGYLGTYLTNGTAFYENAVLDLFDKFYYLGLFGYLSTFPKIEKTKKHIYIFVLYSFLTLLTGIRGELVVNILFIVWYLSKRDEIIKDENTILNKRRILILSVIAVISFSLLYEFNYTRFGQHSSEKGILNKVLGFVEVQGGSGRLVGLSLEYRDDMLQYISPVMMIIYPVRNFLINNSLVRIFTGGVLGQSLEALRRTPSFGTVLTYVTNPGSYLNGSGMGTCYVAELATSYGIITILIFSAILGFLLTKIDKVRLSDWEKNVLCMNAFTVLTYIPRHSLLQILPDSAAAIIFVLIIKALAKRGTLGWHKR